MLIHLQPFAVAHTAALLRHQPGTRTATRPGHSTRPSRLMQTRGNARTASRDLPPPRGYAACLPRSGRPSCGEPVAPSFASRGPGVRIPSAPLGNAGQREADLWPAVFQDRFDRGLTVWMILVAYWRRAGLRGRVRVLAEFRGKVAEAGLEQVALDALLARLISAGLVKAGGKQRTDSTHVIAAVAALNRLELAGESVRAAVEALAAAHPAWLEQRICVSGWTSRYGTPLTSWRPPASQRSRMSWPSPMPGTGTRCWKRSTTSLPRRGRGTCPPSRCCAGCWCRTAPAPSPQAGGR